MIRAIRPIAMSQDDATPVSGWNIAPNVAYVLSLLPGPAACGVVLFDELGNTIIASGAALAGTAQPCVLVPQSGAVSMVDPDLGWHLLLTTQGTESSRMIRIGPAVDLPDEIHPIYADDDLALVRARAAVDEHTHYPADISVMSPLGFWAWLGDIARIPVDGSAMDGQTESITWTGTAAGMSDQAAIRRYVAIAPEPFVEPIPPALSDDVATADAVTDLFGNVLTNDDTGLVVVAVNGMSAAVGLPVTGSNGGTFTIHADGLWTFSPGDNFLSLPPLGSEVTSITYHASNGSAEEMATLSVTVTHANIAPVANQDAATTDATTTVSGNVLTNDTDAEGNTLFVSKVSGIVGNVGVAVPGSNGGSFLIYSNGAWSFSPGSDFTGLTGAQTAVTTVQYHVSDGQAEDEGALSVTVSAASLLFSYSDAFDVFDTLKWQKVGLSSVSSVDGKLVVIPNPSTWGLEVGNMVKFIGGDIPESFELVANLSWDGGSAYSLGQVFIRLQTESTFHAIGLYDGMSSSNPTFVTACLGVQEGSTATSVSGAVEFKLRFLDGILEYYRNGVLVNSRTIGLTPILWMGLTCTQYETYPHLAPKWHDISIVQLESLLEGSVYRFPAADPLVWDTSSLASASYSDGYMITEGKTNSWTQLSTNLANFLGAMPTGDFEAEALLWFIYRSGCLGEIYLYLEIGTEKHYVGLQDDNQSYDALQFASLNGSTWTGARKGGGNGIILKIKRVEATVTAYINGTLVKTGTSAGAAVTKIGLTNTRLTTYNGITAKWGYFRIKYGS